ncbi:alpha/beta hydrolase [Herminiimonas sp. CN]|uniref:PHA/PHB synthase family protein n=1 Tax=Herminiimonas sp. CN TaxID=1349818 RepID=UPI0004743F02|nr:alpha/beta fold hydrolase [Herminiimonas sp. CN]
MKPTEKNLGRNRSLPLATVAEASGPQDDAAPKKLCYLDREQAGTNTLDLMYQSALAKLTGGLSPTSLSVAMLEWWQQLAMSPGHRIELLALLRRQAAEWGPFMSSAISSGTGQVGVTVSDSRFNRPEWSHWPYNVFAKSFLQTQEFWQQATTGIRGVTPHHEHVVNFSARQLLDVFAPSNYAITNPEVLRATIESKGNNRLMGWTHWLEDQTKRKQKQRGIDHRKHPDYPHKVGQDVAVTPGKVVFRNALFELIQYTPQSATVYREPVLFVPSWIMKYYILDLSPHNSMVRFLVEQGHTVFMMSWKNHGAESRDLGMDDYVSQGLYAALKEVAHLMPGIPLHAVGYCLGGTLLSIGAAALGRDPRQTLAPIQSITLLAAQADFADPGELGLFIDDSQLALLDALMWEQGYLDGAQMAASFELLNSRDLIWSRIMREYLLGVRRAPNDLMSWNADTTRLPYRMHSEYLRHLFLHNDLAEGRYCVDGHLIALSNIRQPMFVLGTEHDHVSPWKSVYKIHFLTESEVHFVLASGGHNSGVVSEPGHAGRSFRFKPGQRPAGSYVGPDEWIAQASAEQGSWWPHWHKWLMLHSSAKRIKAQGIPPECVLDEAPGQYVLEA